MVTESQLSFRDSDANDASLSALSSLVREQRRKGGGAGSSTAEEGVDGQANDALDVSSTTGLEADADALEEEIEQMRVNKRVEAQLLQGTEL